MVNFRLSFVLLCVYTMKLPFSGQSEFLLDRPLRLLGAGFVHGSYLQSRSGVKFEAYYGLRYAHAPVGENRWRSPIMYEARTGLIDASKPGPVCPQLINSKIIGEEDCLTLNIYTPDRTKYDGGLIPVLVYFVNGFFLNALTGVEDVGPQYIMDLKDHKVVLVVPNFRLGMLGLLALDDNEFPGNYGLKDQVAALEWVRNNIHYFSGNRNEVTIWGQGTGGVSTTLHMISAKSQGLFQRAIVESGTALSFTAISHARKARNFSLDFIKSVGCSRNDSKQMRKCLEKKEAEAFVLDRNDNRIKSHPPTSLFLTIESEHEDAFLTDEPCQWLIKGNFRRVPFAIGLTSQDGAVITDPLFTYNRSYITKCQQEYLQCFPKEFGYIYTAADKDAVSDRINDYYFSEKSNRTDSLFQRWTDAHTDRNFLQPMIDFVKLYNAPAFVYYYLYKSTAYSYSVEYGDQMVHGPTFRDQTIEQFASKKEPEGLHGIDLMVSIRAIEWIVNFTIYGNPNGREEQIWKPATWYAMEHLNISNLLSNSLKLFRRNPNGREEQIWKPATRYDMKHLNIEQDGSIRMQNGLIRESGYDVWNKANISKNH